MRRNGRARCLRWPIPTGWRSGASADNDAGLARAIGEEMHKRIMARINVEIVDPGALPRTFSKAKRITDLRLND